MDVAYVLPRLGHKSWYRFYNTSLHYRKQVL